MRSLKRLFVITVLLVLGACANVPPTPARLGLKLAPITLGTAISVQQHLRVERGGRSDELDAALEVDAEHLELVGLAFGQRVLALHYDGKKLTSWRHPMLPEQVRAEDVLEDMQLTLWPVAAIQQALPPGWRIEERELRRTLYMDDTPVTVINYSAWPVWHGTTVLENLRYHYRLTIQSAPVGH